MQITSKQKSIIESVINAFESGSALGNYAAISVADDGPWGIKQISYGRSQATEFASGGGYSNLALLLRQYVAIGGVFRHQLLPYLPKIGVKPLVNDAAFKRILKEAGRNDIKMQEAQNSFFEQHYFAPALGFASQEGFAQPLSLLVIYDSYIQSGGIRRAIRDKFRELPPGRGGDEAAWVGSYVRARRRWLASSAKPAVQASVYRMDTMMQLIKSNNWELTQLPIVTANGVVVRG